MGRDIFRRDPREVLRERLFQAIKKSPTAVGNIIWVRELDIKLVDPSSLSPEILRYIGEGLDRNVTLLNQKASRSSLKKCAALESLISRMQLYCKIVDSKGSRSKTLTQIIEEKESGVSEEKEEEISPDQRLDNYINMIRGGQIS